MKIAVFPGSFDPITTGHVDLIKRSLPLFDKIYVAVGVNSNKKTLFTLTTRLKWLKEVFKEEPKIEVSHFEGLTVDFSKSVKANYLIRGLRNSSDFDYEKTISQLNSVIGNGLETFFLISIFSTIASIKRSTLPKLSNPIVGIILLCILWNSSFEILLFFNADEKFLEACLSPRLRASSSRTKRANHGISCRRSAPI